MKSNAVLKLYYEYFDDNDATYYILNDTLKFRQYSVF